MLPASESGALHSAWLLRALLCWHLCCWPQAQDSDTNSDKSSGGRGVTRHESGPPRRGSELFSRRLASSAASLHLPSTSGSRKEPLSAHRSHEEIGRRQSGGAGGRGGGEGAGGERYHSAPSVIREVLHRRDWDRSTRDLYIPLKPEGQALRSESTESLEAPRTQAESSSLESGAEGRAEGRACKKHHCNIKSSRAARGSRGKEGASTDDKDRDATEIYYFYIGDNEYGHEVSKEAPREYRAKEAKQEYNESLRRAPGSVLDDVIARLHSPDRSGAAHRHLEPRASPERLLIPPPSVAAVGYEGGACYLAEAGPARGLRGAPASAPAPTTGAGALRARHASDGDILAPHHRPESGAFSESDLDLEVEGLEPHAEELPPPYEELHSLQPHYSHLPDKKETAI